MHPKRLYYKRQGNWIPLPRWGQFFLNLGYTLTMRDNPENRVIAGLALPTRAYAASLTAVGVVDGKLSHQARVVDCYNRFQELCTLNKGTSLLYHRENRRVKVFYDGMKDIEGERKILLRAEKQEGGLTYAIGQKFALQVEFPNKEFTSLPKHSNELTHRLYRTTPPFLSNFLDNETATAIVLQSHLDCIIIGSIGRLDQEINCRSFATQNTKGDFECGTLQEVIRARRFSSNSDTYRSDVYFTHSKEQPRIQYEMPNVVIFDGAMSYLKWRTFWSHPHCIILFDQTEPGFDAAIQIFNEECIKNHLDDVVFKEQLTAPKGVPISIYQEVRK